MDKFIVRKFEEAAFVLNINTQKAIFFEGLISFAVPEIFSKPNYELPESFVRNFPESDREFVLIDFKKVQNEVLNFKKNCSKNVNKIKTDEDSEPDESFYNLKEYALKQWLITAVNIELTQLCNNRCEWCYHTDFSEYGLKKEEVQLIANEFVKQGTIFTCITGGEIFLRKDSLDILKVLHEKGFALDIKTNGLLLNEEIIQFLSNMNIMDTQVSIYGISDSKNSLTGSDYNYSKVYKNICKLIEKGVPTTLSVLVGKHNIDQIDDIHNKLSSIEGANIFYNPTIMSNTKTNNTIFRLSRKELIEKLYPFLVKVNKFSRLTRKYRNCDQDEKICNAGINQVTIDAKGFVHPCIDWRLTFGNIKNSKLSDILSSRKKILNKFKIYDIPKCNYCNIRDYCDSCVGLAIRENQDYREPSSHKCDLTHFYLMKGGD